MRTRGRPASGITNANLTNKREFGSVEGEELLMVSEKKMRVEVEMTLDIRQGVETAKQLHLVL